jgi:hypothetical protein
MLKVTFYCRKSTYFDILKNWFVFLTMLSITNPSTMLRLLAHLLSSNGSEQNCGKKETCLWLQSVEQI